MSGFLGILADLRSLTNERVRAFHLAYYRPENLAIIVTGTLTETDERMLFESLSEFEEKMLKKATKEKVRMRLSLPHGLFVLALLAPSFPARIHPIIRLPLLFILRIIY